MLTSLFRILKNSQHYIDDLRTDTHGEVCWATDSNKKAALPVFTKVLIAIVRESLLFLKVTENYQS